MVPAPAAAQRRAHVPTRTGLNAARADRPAVAPRGALAPPQPGKCSCGGGCPRCASRTSDPAEPLERSADAMASRALGEGGVPRHSLAATGAAREAAGTPLEPELKHALERRFDTGLDAVRLHAGRAAAAQAHALQADAYTVGTDVVLGAGWRPDTPAGQHLLLHEIAHAVQAMHGETRPGVAYRQYTGMTSSDADLAAEREYGDNGAPNAKACGRPSHCPPGFCDPYRSEDLAKYYRAKNGGLIMFGIARAVNSRVVPLWREYLDGGSPPKNLTADFGTDFTNSPTTAKTTRLVRQELAKVLAASPPAIPLYGSTQVDLPTLLPTVAKAINDPVGADQMNFSVPRDVPGNLAGGIGTDQATCASGAQPSPFADQRLLGGQAKVWRVAPTSLLVQPDIRFTVKDTIDLCPGDCGTRLEQVATVPLSQFEATGISGDVPFTVEFAAPDNTFFMVSTAAPAPAPAPAPASPAPAPAPAKPSP